MGAARQSFRQSVSSMLGVGEGVVRVGCRFQPGWSVRGHLSLWRLSRPPAWFEDRPLSGVGVSGPRRWAEEDLRGDGVFSGREVVLFGQRDSLYAWLLIWSRHAPDSLFANFTIDVSPFDGDGEVEG